MSWQALLAEARAGARLSDSPDHGERHWRAVAAIGFEIARRDGRADPAVCLAFAVLHDCRRISEYRDPRHGPAAARMARASQVLPALIGAERTEIVAHACHDHEGGPPRPGAPLIGACFDADRFTLGRVGIEPAPEYFSVLRAEPQFSDMVVFAEGASADPPAWEDLFRRIAPP